MFRRILPVLTAASAAVLLMPVSPVSASTDIDYDTEDAGYSGMFNGEPAGRYRFTIEGSSVVAYCVDFDRSLNQAGAYSAVPAAASGVPGIAAAGFIAANHATLGTPLTDANFEAAATQVAIWSKTNNATIDATTTPYVEVRTRAAEILAAAGTSTLSSGPADYTLTVSPVADGDSVVFSAVLTADGAPQAGRNVSFTTASGTTTVATDASGVALLDVPAAPGASVSATAVFSGVLPAGTVLRTSSAADQPLVLAQSVNVSRSASATAQVVAAATTTAPPTTTAPATTVPATTATPVSTSPLGTAAPSAVPTALPYTGEDGSSSWLLPAGVVLLVVAAAGGLFLRRSN